MDPLQAGLARAGDVRLRIIDENASMSRSADGRDAGLEELGRGLHGPNLVREHEVIEMAHHFVKAVPEKPGVQDVRVRTEQERVARLLQDGNQPGDGLVQ